MSKRPPTSALLWPSWIDAADDIDDVQRAARAEVTRDFVTYREDVYRYLVYTRCRRAEAEEITQDVFLRLYRARLGGKRIQDVRRWVFTVARNMAIDRTRRARHERLLPHDSAVTVIDNLPDRQPNGEDTLEAARRRMVLARALAELTDLQRECLHLRAQGLSLREVGAIVGVPIWGVSDAVRRAIKRLRKEVDAQG